MTGRNITIAFTMSLMVSSLPLACGDDEPPNGGDAGSAGEVTGGSGGNAGKATGGSAGKATGGTAGQATGGSGGSAGKATGGSAGKATGGTGVGGASDGGAGGGTSGGEGGLPAAGAGGEGGESPTARCERLCEIAASANCPDMSQCVEMFCEVWLNAYPDCRPYAQAALQCMDAEATAVDFACWLDRPSYNTRGAEHCRDEVDAAIGAYCL